MPNSHIFQYLTKRKKGKYLKLSPQLTEYEEYIKANKTKLHHQ